MMHIDPRYIENIAVPTFNPPVRNFKLSGSGKTYAAIGSRETPVVFLDHARRKGKEFAQRNFFLRSGGARGFDKAAEEFVPSDKKRIYRPEDVEEREDCLLHAESFHPKWSACDHGARLLHARNSLILLGDDLGSPVDFVLCWTKDGKATGGTGQGLRIAKDWNIPVFNMYFRDWETDLEFFLEFH